MHSSFVQPRALGMIAVGIGLGVIITLGVTQLLPASTAKLSMSSSVEPTSKVLYWYDPMVPAQHFDKPGKSPFMDMELVPKYADTGTTANSFRIDSAQVQNLGMRTAKVMRLPLHAQRDFPGTLRFNERNQAVIQLRAAGFVEKAWPLALGDRITAGQPIATFYIPQWLDTQNELLASKMINSPRLLETLRTRLRLLGMPDALIDRVELTRKPETRVTITAPITGVVESLEIKAGMSLASGQTLASITTIDSLWLDVAIPEAEASGLRLGDTAIFYATNAKAAPVTGKIDSLLPALNDATRTITARVVLPNPGGALKPGTSGHVVLNGNQTDTGLLIPTEAVIRTGKRTLVMVADAENHFRPVMVMPGQEIGDQTVILSGLEEGQDIVVSGQFLLDSEASMLSIEPTPLPTESANAVPTEPIADSGVYQASGHIVNLSAKEVRLNHGDFIDTVSKKVLMPAMTMAFPLAKPSVASGFKIGDAVRVTARETNGGLVIERMEIETKLNKEKQP